MLNRENVQLEAQKWLGVKWRHQGRTRNGVDCAGLIFIVARELGYPAKDYQGYSRTANGFDFLNVFQSQMDEINAEDVQPGDVLIFQDTYYPCHCGFLVELHGTNYLLHSHAFHRRVILDNLGSWRSRWCNTFKFRGID